MKQLFTVCFLVLIFNISYTQNFFVSAPDANTPAIRIEDSSGSEHNFLNTLNNGDLAFYSNNFTNELMRLKDDTGWLGIGTTAPLSIFEVKFSGFNGIHINGDDTADIFLSLENGGGYHYLFDDDDTAHCLDLESSNDLAFNTGGPVERVRITDSGDVGIGTTTPSAKLEIKVPGNNGVYINGDGTGDARLSLDNDNGTHYIFDDLSDGNKLDIESAHDIAINVGGANERMSIINSENSTATADGPLNIGNSITDFHLTLDKNEIQAKGTSSSAFVNLFLNHWGGDVRIGNTILSVDRSASSVGINDTSPDALLDVDGTSDAMNLGGRGASPGYLNIERPTGSSNTIVARFRDNASSLATINETADTYQFTVFGDAFASGGSWTNSDEYLKTNIENYTDALEKVLALKPKSYTFTDSPEYQFLNLPTENQIGFLAQELQEVIPEVVKESNMINADNESLESHHLHAVNYDALIPVLTRAIQEQHEIIIKLEERIALLESN